MNLYTNIKSDLYKFFRNPLLLIHLIIPAIGATLFLWYYSFSPWDEIYKLATYIQLLSVIFPILIAIITSVAAQTEQSAGSFQPLLSEPTAKYIAHLSKLILLIIFGLISSLLTLVGFGTGFIIMGYTTFKLCFYIKAACLLLVSMLPLYLLQYIVAFVFGKGPCLGLGIIGGLLSALLLTGLGDGIWWWLPWGIAARCSDVLLMSRLSDIEYLHYGDNIKAVLFIVLFCMAFTALLLLIFSKWEGKKTED